MPDDVRDKPLPSWVKAGRRLDEAPTPNPLPLVGGGFAASTASADANKKPPPQEGFAAPTASGAPNKKPPPEGGGGREAAGGGGAPLNRGEFLREGAQALGQVGTRLGAMLLGRVADRVAPTLMRPPGALPESAFLQACTRCGECAIACHQDSILVADATKGVSIQTPYLDVMDHNPCYLCSKPPCIAVCPSGALLPTEPQDFRMGTARILPEHCLAYAGTACTRCVERCPYQGEAIRTDDDGLPVVDAQHCTGCGLCHHACPTSPKALVIEVL